MAEVVSGVTSALACRSAARTEAALRHLVLVPDPAVLIRS